MTGVQTCALPICEIAEADKDYAHAATRRSKERRGVEAEEDHYAIFKKKSRRK